MHYGCGNSPEVAGSTFGAFCTFTSLYDGPQPMIENPHQSAEEVCVQDGLVCGNCFQLGTKGHDPKHDLLKCERCKVVYYCDRDCQRGHWKRHKKTCGKEESHEVNDRQRVYNELVCCRKFARKYPLPAFQDMPRPPFYSKDIHDLFADAYKFLGKASFGERCTLLCEHLGRKGGPPLMGECFLFLNHYLQTLPQEGEVIEITHALRIIG